MTMSSFVILTLCLEWSVCDKVPNRTFFFSGWVQKLTCGDFSVLVSLGGWFYCLWQGPALLPENHMMSCWSHRCKRFPTLITSHASMRAAWECWGTAQEVLRFRVPGNSVMRCPALPWHWDRRARGRWLCGQTVLIGGTKNWPFLLMDGELGTKINSFGIKHTILRLC